MTSRSLDRVLSLVASGFWSSICLCVLNVPLANAAALPKGESGAGSAPPQGVAVEEVQRIVRQARGKGDAAVARLLSDLELTERMSSAKLQSLEQSIPGAKSRRALVALADAAVFLSPAAADVLSEAAPDMTEQRRMLDLTVGYLAKTLPRLPNFYATRTIVRFEAMQGGRRTREVSWNHASWRQVGNSKVVVAYRDGKEVVAPREWGKHPYHPEGEGLITRGTFGPILSIVMGDAAHGEVARARWERGSAGKVAVFRYRVPIEHSHYSAGFHSLSGDDADAAAVTGYHGEAAIDPATGTILRLTVQAEQPLGSLILQGDIMVEYGPVEIGGKTYTCPVRSVSILMGATEWIRTIGTFGESAPPPETTLLNDVAFENYHQFRSNSRILTGTIPAADH